MGAPVDVLAVMENLSGHGVGHYWTDDDMQTEAINATIAFKEFCDSVLEESGLTSDENTRKALRAALARVQGGAA